MLHLSGLGGLGIGSYQVKHYLEPALATKMITSEVAKRPQQSNKSKPATSRPNAKKNTVVSVDELATLKKSAHNTRNYQERELAKEMDIEAVSNHM